ncbi:S-adenosylmethionine decarboxylase isoform X2 [Oratosquilla oratoria]|uniref:S-adenosylmethionine decarboxylase isoform X2 n=1 Tax=Oratosquilla oratoria TaxID=337810 RepID=UPI003F767D4F
MSQSLANMINNNDSTHFEGVEKLLEVWFMRKDGMTSSCDLRKIPRSQLELVLHEVKCEIISTTSTDELDAYVLSESSMFISCRRFILKTCGTTTPLKCLPLLLSLVNQYTGYDTVQDLYYSRKNFKRPELQVTPHRSFEEEVRILDQVFPGGRAYCMGSLNREDCWYLYTVSPGRPRQHPNAARQNLPHYRAIKSKREPDQTLEVLMMDLDQEKMKYFYKKNNSTAAEVTKKTGIDKLIPGVIIDDYLFDPCGYSMNGVMRSVAGAYMTIHITPEPEFSYVSFETNIPQKSYKDLVQRVINIFGPKQFVLTFFASVGSGNCINISDDSNSVPQYSDYDVDDIQICRLPGYDLTYALYNRFPS